MEQLGSHWTEFNDTWYLNIFRISVREIKVPSKSEMKNGSLTQRLTGIFD
jgi:hypothetical protein